MALPRFRFLDGTPSAIDDAQFWRDVEASERLGSRFKANLFLRELCRAKAWNGALPGADRDACSTAERELLRAVVARGYRLFGPDLEPDVTPLASTG